MQPMTVESLFADATRHEELGDAMRADRQVKRALWLEQSARDEAYFIGPSVLPRLYQKHKVTIKKGTTITGTFPDSQADGHFPDGRRYKVAKRTYTVEVVDISQGYMQQDWPHKTQGVGAHIKNPEIVFVGSGGYWCYVDLNDIPEAVEMAVSDNLRNDIDRFADVA